MPNLDDDIPHSEMFTVRIENVRPDAKTESLVRVFGKCGRIGDVYIPRDDQNKSRGFGFVRFYEERDALYAVRTLNYTMMEGRRVQVSLGRRASTNRTSDSGDRSSGTCHSRGSSADFKKQTRNVSDQPHNDFFKDIKRERSPLELEHLKSNSCRPLSSSHRPSPPGHRPLPPGNKPSPPGHRPSPPGHKPSPPGRRPLPPKCINSSLQIKREKSPVNSRGHGTLIQPSRESFPLQMTSKRMMPPRKGDRESTSRLQYSPKHETSACDYPTYQDSPRRQLPQRGSPHSQNKRTISSPMYSSARHNSPPRYASPPRRPSPSRRSSPPRNLSPRRSHSPVTARGRSPVSRDGQRLSPQQSPVYTPVDRRTNNNSLEYNSRDESPPRIVRDLSPPVVTSQTPKRNQPLHEKFSMMDRKLSVLSRLSPSPPPSRSLDKCSRSRSPLNDNQINGSSRSQSPSHAACNLVGRSSPIVLFGKNHKFNRNDKSDNNQDDWNYYSNSKDSGSYHSNNKDNTRNNRKDYWNNSNKQSPWHESRRSQKQHNSRRSPQQNDGRKIRCYRSRSR